MQKPWTVRYFVLLGFEVVTFPFYTESHQNLVLDYMFKIHSCLIFCYEMSISKRTMIQTYNLRCIFENTNKALLELYLQIAWPI